MKYKFSQYRYAVFFIVTFLWVFSLSLWMFSGSGIQLAQRWDVFLGCDANVWVSWLDQQGYLCNWNKFDTIHPVFKHLWMTISLPGYLLLNRFFIAPWGAIFAACFTQAAVVSVGACALLALARRPEESLGRAVPALLLLSYICSSTMVTISFPEHFGISAAILSLSAYCYCAPRSVRFKSAVLLFLAGLAFLTTLTNVLFPLVLFSCVRCQRSGNSSWNWVQQHFRQIIAAAFVGLVAIATIGYYKPHAVVAAVKRLDNKKEQCLHLRLLKHPMAALPYMAAGIAYPAVSPAPEVAAGGCTQEPLTWSSFRRYTCLQWIALLAWLTLLASSTWNALWEQKTRWIAGVLSGWILFNLLFHNIWSDEFMLFAPHWSWAMMALVFLGYHRLPVRASVCLAATMIPGQLQFILQAKSALDCLL